LSCDIDFSCRFLPLTSSFKASMKSNRLASAARWRTACRVGGQRRHRYKEQFANQSRKKRLEEIMQQLAALHPRRDSH
jgi:hypothetical protein